MRFAIICWEFADAQRARSLAEGLTDAGHLVTFFTAEQAAQHESYRVVSIPFVRASGRLRSAVGIAPEVNLAKAARSHGRSLARAVSLAARVFETLTQYPDKYRAWIPAVRAWLRANPHALDGTDIVVASSPPPSALFVGRMLAQACDARLVYDFRDLWTDNPSYPYCAARKAVDRVLEREIMKAPIAAIAATQSFVNTLHWRHPELPVRAVYTGIDPTPWAGLPAREPDGRLVFGHFGVWYPQKRSIKPLLESLRRLADTGSVDLNRVSIQLWGNGADDDTWDATRDLSMDGVVEDCGRLEPGEVPPVLARVDVALLLAWPEDTISVPLKTHGYIASGKPILVLGANPASEMAALLRGVAGVTFALTPADVDTAVLEYWHAASAGQSSRWTLAQRPLPISQEVMVRDVIALLGELPQQSIPSS
jgi:hypothetical protein